MANRLAVLVSLSLLAGCAKTSHHPTQPSALGTPRRAADLLAVIDQPGPLEVETVNSADWEVDRSGLVNLDHPKAKQAHLEDGPEPIRLFLHVVRHPSRGTFLIDTGVERAFRDHPDDTVAKGIVSKGMHAEKLKVHAPLGDVLAKEKGPISGVLLTHLHLDHILGLRDVPNAVPVYLGPGETSPRSAMNLVLNGVTDRALEGKGPANEWQFQADADGRFDGVIDVLGDGSLWAISVPGHTPGSTAYLARTKSGPVLFVGDTCHTAWGWEHDVEPGSFTADRAKNAENLARLRRLVAEHPAISVRLGHQALPATATAAAGQ